MVKTRECSASTLDYLLIELVRYYRTRPDGPALEDALESIGLRVGAAAAERCVRGRAPPPTQLELMKLVCKELWSDLFGKVVDNLRTNHRGTYVLRDVSFRWLARLHQNAVPAAPGDPRPPQLPKAELARDWLVLPCAVVRGALGALGLEATVSADATQLPQIDFTVVVGPRPGDPEF